MEPDHTETPGVTGAPERPAAPAAALATAPAPAAAPTAGERQPSRRRFLRWLGGLTVVSTAAMVITPIIGFLIPSSNGASSGGGKVAVGNLSDLPAGAGKVVAMGSKPAIVINTTAGVKAYSAICTHLGCVVAWNDMIGAIQCPCHDGHFNPVTGAVLSGPPPAPLPALNVSVENDGQIFVTEA